jgi:hypothetical protein
MLSMLEYTGDTDNNCLQYSALVLCRQWVFQPLEPYHINRTKSHTAHL